QPAERAARALRPDAEPVRTLNSGRAPVRASTSWAAGSRPAAPAWPGRAAAPAPPAPAHVATAKVTLSARAEPTASAVRAGRALILLGMLCWSPLCAVAR